MLLKDLPALSSHKSERVNGKRPPPSTMDLWPRGHLTAPASRFLKSTHNTAILKISTQEGYEVNNVNILYILSISFCLLIFTY